jgi:hypothetical protein
LQIGCHGETPGVPDGIFSYQKSHFWLIFEGLQMEILGIFYGHFVVIKAFGKFFWSFGRYFSILVCNTENNLATLVKLTLDIKNPNLPYLTEGRWKFNNSRT